MDKHCKLCSYKPENILSLCLKSIEMKQDLLFHGYLRIKMPNNNDNAPIAIINLCFKFYFVTLKLKNPKSSTDEQLKELRKMAYKSYRNHENFVAFKMYQFIEHNFKDGYCECKRAEILTRWKEYDRSEMLFIQAMTASESTIDLKIKYIYRYAVSLGDQNKFKLALGQIQKAYEISQKDQNKPVIKKWMLRCMLFMAHCYRELKDLKNAKIHYDKLIELDPKQAMAYYDCAFMLRDIVKDYKEAEEYYLKCLEINDTDSDIIWILGSYVYLLYLMGEYEKGLKWGKLAMDMDKKGMNHAFNYGYFNHLLGNKGEAEAGFQNALKLVETKEDMIKIVKSLDGIKETDLENRRYVDRFIKTIKDKFQQK